MKPRTVWRGVQFGSIATKSMILNSVSSDLAKRYLLKEMSRLPGLGQKMGQVLNLRLGLLKESEFKPTPAPLSWVKARIESEIPALAEQILEINPEPVLASLGQVHRVRLVTGADLAIKLRYPNIERELFEQLDLLFFGFRTAPKFVRESMDIESYETFLRAFFREELDYRHEADSQRKFRDAWKGVSGFVIPKIFEEFSSDSILVQSFEESVTLEKLVEHSHEARTQCSALLTRFFLDGLCRTGWVHADLHPRNWGYRPETRELVAYDFGSTLCLDETVRAALRVLIEGRDLSVSECLEAYTTIGFDPEILEKVSEVLPQLTALFSEPLREQASFDFRKWNPQERAEALLGNRKWDFRGAGPPWFLMLMRSFNGWSFALRELQSRTVSEKNPEPMNTKLYVEVRDSGVEIVSLEFPARTVESLEDLMPETVLDDLRHEGVSLVNIKAEALSSGLKPQSLFEKTKGSRVYRVWLE